MTRQSIVKHIINDPETLVAESIQGLCYAHPHLRWIENERVVCLADIEQVAQRQVTLVAGGGSGHEPGHAGYVGHGMLSAAVCGHVFASPSASQVLAALERVQSPHGTLVIVMNYTGDCLNFGLAVERAKARGIKVAMVIIGDDISVQENTRVGRRGMAATTLAIKLAGALAARGASLEAVYEMANRVNQEAATLGVALDHCHVPGRGPLTHLADDQLELGVGIHNEPGFSRVPVMPAQDLVKDMAGRLRHHIQENSRVVLLVNNLGGLSILELNLIVKEAVTSLSAFLQIERVLAGSFLTSLNMPGVSLTLLSLSREPDEVLSLLDYSVDAPGWPAVSHSFSRTITMPEQRETISATSSRSWAHDTEPVQLKRIIREAAQAVVLAEPDVTLYDTLQGDGDCGHTLRRGALAILDALETLPLQSGSGTILGIADAIERSVGGTSSAIYCIYLNALAGGLSQQGDWIKASVHALDALKSYTLARVGDRTLMDVLIPFIETLGRTRSLSQAVQVARDAAKSTAQMTARMGRASYVSGGSVPNVPDAGAWGLAALLEGLLKGYQE